MIVTVLLIIGVLMGASFATGAVGEMKENGTYGAMGTLLGFAIALLVVCSYVLIAGGRLV